MPVPFLIQYIAFSHCCYDPEYDTPEDDIFYDEDTSEDLSDDADYLSDLY